MYIKIIFLLLLVPIYTHAVVPLLMPRSQSTNLAREIIQCYTDHVNPESAQLFVTPEMVKTFRPELVAQSLFGPLLCTPLERRDVTPHCTKTNCHVQKRECRSSIVIAGSQSEHRTSTNLLADYCGLPTDYESIIHVRPHYSSALIDIGGYIPCDRILNNSYIFIHTPLEHTWWSLNLQETMLNPGTNNYAAGYFDTDIVPREKLVDTFINFANGTQVPQLINTQYKPLQYARIFCAPQSKTRCADVQIALGWNPVHTHRYSVSSALRIVAPTGTRPAAIRLFEPIIGNGHHWQLGVELLGHLVAWENKLNTENCTIEMGFLLSHLFPTHQRRTFDVYEKPLSRYMLAQQMDIINTDNLQASGEKPAYLFAQRFEPVANLTTSDVTLSINLECEFSLLFSFNRDQFSWHIGYELWAQHGITMTVCNNRLMHETWALKGDAQVFGFMAADDTPLVQNQAIALSATQSDATITSGTNMPRGTTDISAAQHNPAIDTPTAATAGTSNTRLLYRPNVANTADNQINTSATPILLTNDSIDFDGAHMRHIEQSLFMHFSYTMDTYHDITPTIGLGAEVAFGQSNDQNNANNCLINRAFSYWGLWAHFGILLD